MGVAAELTLGEDNTISAAHLALMGVAATPIRAQAAEALLLGEPPDEGVFTAATERAAADLDPDTDTLCASFRLTEELDRQVSQS